MGSAALIALGDVTHSHGAAVHNDGNALDGPLGAQPVKKIRPAMYAEVVIEEDKRGPNVRTAIVVGLQTKVRQRGVEVIDGVKVESILFPANGFFN